MLFQQEKWGHIWNSWLNRYFPPCVVLDIYSPTQLIVSRIGAQNVYCVQLNPQQLYYKFQGDRGVRRKGTLKWVSGSLELTSIQLGENSGSLPNLWKLIFCRNASASNLGQNMVAVLCHRRVFLKKKVTKTTKTTVFENNQKCLISHFWMIFKTCKKSLLQKKKKQ